MMTKECPICHRVFKETGFSNHLKRIYHIGPIDPSARQVQVANSIEEYLEREEREKKDAT